MFLKLLLLSLFFVGLAMMALAIKILVLKDGRFPVTTVGGNMHLKKRGIRCPKHEELREHRKYMSGEECKGCGFQV